jgi:undecaprenyl-diphosphatase
MSWLESLIYGFVSGFAQILPVSAPAHQILLLKMFGYSAEAPLMRLLIHGAIALALYYNCRGRVDHLMRQRKISRYRRRRRSRYWDPNAQAELSCLTTISMFLLPSFLLYNTAEDFGGTLSYLAAFMVLNGILLYIPEHLASGNKDARTLSRLDGTLIGLASIVSVLPGVSRMGVLLSAAVARGADRRHALNWAMLLSIPATICLVLIDFLGIFQHGSGVVGFAGLVMCAAAAVSAYVGTHLGIKFMRFLAVNAGYTGFAYYSWGAALFTFILFLAI